jgi:ATP-binding cassette subfamily B protein
MNFASILERLRATLRRFNPFRAAAQVRPQTPFAPQKNSFSFKDRFTALQNLPRLFALIWETSRLLTFASVALRLVRAAIPTLTLYVGKLIVDEVVRLMQQGGSANHLWELVALELGLALVSDVLNRSIALSDSLLGDLFANETSVRLMRHAATLDLEMFEDATFYDKLEKARRQTTSRITLMTQTLAQAQDAVSMVFLGIGLAAFAPWLLLLLVVAVIPSFVGESFFNARSYSLLNNWTPERRELDYLRFTGASDDTAKEVKMFGLADFLTDRYKSLSDEYYRQNRGLAVQRAVWGAVLATVGTGGYYAAYAYILYQTAQGRITLGDMTFLAGTFRGLRGSLETVLGRFAGIAEAALYLRDLFDFFAMQPRIDGASSTVSAQRIRSDHSAHTVHFPKPIREGFVFENVGFKYLNAEHWALQNVSFTLKAGEKLALVGENGAGKTTLVKLLARLYDPTEGRILLDGRDLREYSAAELRAEMGVIFQDFVRYQMDAGTNIAVGRIEERANTPRIDRAAAQSLADSVIAGLPKGYEQMIGRRFAGGTDLSGGQWQKIALARAYMRDAQVLILDEPTAALDARAEFEIFERFAELTHGKTAVLISHRFSTVRMADRILVLGKVEGLTGGTALEIGSHEDLLASGGRYAELFRLQAKGYL